MNGIYIFGLTLAGIGFVISGIGFGSILKDWLSIWEVNHIDRKLRKEHAEKYGRS